MPNAHPGRRRRPGTGTARRCRPSLMTLEDRVVLSGVPTQWAVRGSGGGGALFAPQINPNNPAEYFVSSDMSELFHSTDSGASWKMLDFRQIQGGHETKVQYTEVPNLVYALDYSSINGVDNQRPATSTDGGKTWTPLANDPTGSGAFYFFADPANHNRLAIADYTHVYLSTDAGQHWALKYTAKNSGAGIVLGGAFWDGSNVYFGTNDGLLTSTNGGQSFTLATVGGIPAGQVIRSFAGAKQGSTVRFLAVTDNSGDVYGGVQGYDNNGGEQVFTLDLGAANWTSRALPSTAWPDYAGMALNDAATMYVAGGSTIGNPTVYKSADGGATWQSVLKTTGNVNVQTGWSGSGGDRDWSYGELALGFAVDAADSSRVIITDLGFAHASTDGGATWKALYVAPADLNAAGAATPKGRPYHDSGLDNTTSWQVAWADPTHLVVGNSDVRGQVSSDAGQTFGFGYTGQPYNSLLRVAVAKNGVVYGAAGSVHDLYQSTTLTDSRIDGATGAVLYSMDKGTTWQTLHNFGHEVSWVATDPNNPNRLYASVVHSTQGGIYVTNNLSAGAASTWTKLASPPRTEGHPLDVMVLNDGTLVASFSGRRNSAGAFTASSGVFVSKDGGNTWLDRSGPGLKYWTWDVVVDPFDAAQNTWYAGVFSGWGGPPNDLGGLYKTTDRGQTWNRVLTKTGVTSVTFNPADANEMFVTTETDGLYYANAMRASSPAFTPVASYPFRQPERVFFNPYNANEIWVASFGGGVSVGTTTGAAPAGSLQLGAAAYSVNEDAGTATITVNRVGGSAGAVSVSYATSDGTAAAPGDYSATAGTLTWAAGDAAPKTFTVPVLDDPLVDANETVNLSLSAPTGGATLGAPATGVLTIIDNDAPPPSVGTLQFSTTHVSVGEAAGTVVLTVTRTGGSAGAVTVHYATMDGSAVAPGDYSHKDGTLSWADGDAAPKTVVVPIINDPLVDPTEAFYVALSSPTGGATLGTPSVEEVSILDDPPPPVGTLQFTATSVSVGEAAGTVVLTVTRTGGSAGAVTVHYATADGTAIAPGDYSHKDGTLSWADGDAAPKTVVVPIINDPLVDPTEAFHVGLSSPTGGATLGAPSTEEVRILDDDPPPVGTLQFSTAHVSVGEAVGTVVLTVTRTGGSAGAVTVHYATMDGSAVAPGDYSHKDGTLSWADGDAAPKTVSIPIVDDPLVDPTEAFYVALSSPTGGATLGTPGAEEVTIVDDDGVSTAVGAPFAVGTDAGTVDTVTYYNGDGSVRFKVAPFGTSLSNGVRVATGDVTGDRVPDVVVSNIGGGLTPTVVKVIDGKTGTVLPITLSAGAYNYGTASVSVGDVTGDGVGDIAVGTDDGGPRVRIYRGGDFALLASFAAGPALSYWGHTEVALADVTGDKLADVVVTGLYPTGVLVAGFDGKSLKPGAAPVAAFAPFHLDGKGFEGAPYLSAGDVNKDGFADIVLGSGEWSTPRVLVLSGKALVQTGTRVSLADFAPTETAFGFGIRVSLRDLDGDGFADLILGAGKGRGSRVNVYSGKSLLPGVNPVPTYWFDAYAGFTGGVFVG